MTLKFIGEQPEPRSIDQASLINRPRLPPKSNFAATDFFPPRSPRESSGWACKLDLNSQLGRSGRWRPRHSGSPKKIAPSARISRSLARAGGSGSPAHGARHRPNRAFQRLQEKLSALPAPEFGAITAREFFLYQSQLSPKGSKYTKLERFVLQ